MQTGNILGKHTVDTIYLKAQMDFAATAALYIDVLRILLSKYLDNNAPIVC